MAASHEVNVCLFVDDLTTDAVGSAAFIAEVLPAALRECIEVFEQQLQFTVSRGRAWHIDPKAKTVAVASSHALELRLALALRALGVPLHRQVKLLGVDYASGKTCTRHV